MEKSHRSVDMSLKTFFNARERYLEEWKAVLAAADERFVLNRVLVPDHRLSILEVLWDVSGVK